MNCDNKIKSSETCMIEPIIVEEDINDDVVDDVNDTEEEEQTETVEFVPLNGFDDYEILNKYPFTIRRKKDHYEIKERINANGYVQVSLNCKRYYKHRLIALQFLPNPDNLPCIDHISRDRKDYHLENLRFVSRSTNHKNKTSYNRIQARYVDSIPDDAMVVDFYNTRTERHDFEGYYYHDGVFYYDNDMNYRILNINVAKGKCRYVNMRDKNNKIVAVVITRFLEQHDLNE